MLLVRSEQTILIMLQTALPFFADSRQIGQMSAYIHVIGPGPYTIYDFIKIAFFVLDICSVTKYVTL